MKDKTERNIMLIACFVLAAIFWPLSLHLASCREGLFRAIFASKSYPADLAKFYFIVFMGVSVIILQGVFIRRAILRIESAIESQDKTKKLTSE